PSPRRRSVPSGLPAARGRIAHRSRGCRGHRYSSLGVRPGAHAGRPAAAARPKEVDGVSPRIARLIDEAPFIGGLMRGGRGRRGQRVDRIEAFAVRYPEPNNDGKIRALTLVRVETDDGLVGWGEAITGGQEASLAVAFVVERRLAPFVIGSDPRQVGGLWGRMRDATHSDPNP